MVSFGAGTHEELLIGLGTFVRHSCVEFISIVGPYRTAPTALSKCIQVHKDSNPLQPPNPDAICRLKALSPVVLQMFCSCLCIYTNELHAGNVDYMDHHGSRTSIVICSFYFCSTQSPCTKSSEHP